MSWCVSFSASRHDDPRPAWLIGVIASIVGTEEKSQVYDSHGCMSAGPYYF